MDVMFYSLKEVAEKLNKTEREIKEIVREGRLREFREGPNSLFKADEVEALMSDPGIMPSKEPPAPSVQKPDEDEISFTPEPAETQEPIEIPEPTETPELAMTPEMAETPMPPETPEPIEIPEPTETPELAMTPEMAETPMPPETQEPIEIPELTETPELAMTPEMAETPEPIETPEPTDSLELIDTSEPAMMPELSDSLGLIDTSEPAMMPESIETPTAEGDLSSADTAIVGEGTDTFEEMDTGLQATDDTVIEAKDTTTETSLQEIEEDVNLDSFGSGSGLLDLSLQADDTSLGGILDEIYAPEAGEGQQVGETTGSAVEMAAEVDQILPDEFTTPGPARAVPALAQAYAEPEPDTVSNALGIMLFLPLLAVIYTAIVAVTGFSDIMPSIREKVQGSIWYIAGGAVVVALLIIGAAFMLGGKPAAGEKKKKAKKAKKSKKAKEAPAVEEEEETA